MEGEKILILNVDRDNDVGVKAKVKTPIIGRESVLKSAEKLLLNDPEEADGNAMFAAIKIYDKLKEKEVEVEVAVITGSERGGVDADLELDRQLTEVLKVFPADKVILVTDGYSEEEIISIVSSKKPILSIHRIVVKHSKSIEETYAVIGRYIKMLWTESPYKQYFIGIPGIIMLLFGILSLFKLTEVATIYSLIIIGIALIVKGMGIDEYISSLKQAHFYEYVKLVTYLGSISAMLTGIYLSYTNISSLPEFSLVLENPSMIFEVGATLIGYMLPYISFTILTVGLFLILGFSLYNILTDNYSSLYKYPVAFVSVVVFYFLGNEVGQILINPEKGLSGLFLSVILGFLAIFITSAVMYTVSRVRR